MRIAPRLGCEVRQVEHFADTRARCAPRPKPRNPNAMLSVDLQMRKQRIVLEHEPDAASLRRRGEMRPRNHHPFDLDGAGATGRNPAIARNSVVLPQPELPTRHPISPRAAERQRLEHASAVAIGDRQIVDDQKRRGE